MTTSDLLKSLDKTATVLDDAGWWEEAKTLREKKVLLEQAKASGKGKGLGRQIAEIRSLFGGMGSLNDIGGFIRGKMADKEERSAILTINEQLDDLFLNCLFWKTERQEAQQKGESMKKSLSRVTTLQPRVYFHIRPSWFRKWSD